MKTFVIRNPLVATRSIKAGQMVTGKTRQARRKRSNPVPAVLFANPRRRRRNPGMYASNPLVLPNRRKRRRNPYFGYSPATGIKQVLKVTGEGLLGSGVGYMFDRVLFQKLGVTESGADTSGGLLLRNGARLVAGGLVSWLFPGPIGAGFMGSLGYPIWASLEQWWRRSSASSNVDQPTSTSADLQAELSDLEAELADYLEAA